MRTSFFVLHPWQAAIPAVGLTGLCVSYQRLQALERESPALPRRTQLLAAAIAALLAADLLTYRLVPTARSLASGRVGVDWPDAFGTTGPWRSMALAAGFLGTVWHAPMLIQAGLEGPAAAPLVVVPAISLPGMMILGGATRRPGVAALLVVTVMLSGIGVGMLFLWETADSHATGRVSVSRRRARVRFAPFRSTGYHDVEPLRELALPMIRRAPRVARPWARGHSLQSSTRSPGTRLM